MSRRAKSRERTRTAKPSKAKPSTAKKSKNTVVWRGEVSEPSRARSTGPSVRKRREFPDMDDGAVPGIDEALGSNVPGYAYGAPGGRPSGFTEERGRRICMMIAEGVPIAVACRIEGIGKTTLYEWRRQGKEGREPFGEFASELERAKDTCEATITSRLIRASLTDWKAAAWWLERRRPTLYQAKQDITLHKSPAEMSDAELAEMMAELGYVKADAADGGGGPAPAQGGA